jgi:hypothetical protein
MNTQPIYHTHESSNPYWYVRVVGGGGGGLGKYRYCTGTCTYRTQVPVDGC